MNTDFEKQTWVGIQSAMTSLGDLPVFAVKCFVSQSGILHQAPWPGETAVKGKRYLCAICHKRSPNPVKAAAPWYCPACLHLATMQGTSEGGESAQKDLPVQR